jgi:hypothetical protein
VRLTDRIERKPPRRLRAWEVNKKLDAGTLAFSLRYLPTSWLCDLPLSIALYDQEVGDQQNQLDPKSNQCES